MKTEEKLEEKKTIKIYIRTDDKGFNAGLFLDRAKAPEIKEVIVTYLDKYQRAGDFLVSTLVLSAGYKLVNSEYKKCELINSKRPTNTEMWMHVKTLRKEWLELREKLSRRGIKP